MGPVSHRSLIASVALVAAVSGCRTTQPDTGMDGQAPAATPERPVPPAASTPSAGEPTTARPAPVATPTSSPGVELILVLENPVMPAGGDPTVDVEARLDGALHVRNPSSQPVELVGQVPAAFELDWTIVGKNGVQWQPTFLPPPPPRPRPPVTLKVGPGATAPFCNVHGISGFRRPGEDQRHEVLPAGNYTVRVGGVRFRGMPPLQSAPVDLQVK